MYTIMCNPQYHLTHMMSHDAPYTADDDDQLWSLLRDVSCKTVVVMVTKETTSPTQVILHCRFGVVKVFDKLKLIHLPIGSKLDEFMSHNKCY